MFDNVPAAATQPPPLNLPKVPVNLPEAVAPPVNSPVASAVAASSAMAQPVKINGAAKPQQMSAEKLTVMPQKFFVPPKNPTPWLKIVIAILVVVIAGGGIVGAAMYVKNKLQPPEDNKPVVTQNTNSAVTPPVTPPVVVPPDNPPVTPPVTPPVVPVEPVVPPGPAVDPNVKPGLDTDSDSDGLTDIEEQMYGTNKNNPDTDNDKFADGKELVNLYSPNDPDPKKRLWETAIVSPYEHPQHHYQLLYPTGWTARAADSTGREVLFNSPTGEFVSVVAEANPSNLSARDWYSKTTPGADPNTLTPVKTWSGLEGIKNPSETANYLAFPGTEPKMIIISYNIGVKTTASYWSTYQTMVASLQNSSSPYWTSLSLMPVVPVGDQNNNLNAPVVEPGSKP